MLSRFKTALYNVVGSFDPGDGSPGPLAPGLTSGFSTPSPAVRGALLPGSSKEKGVRFPYTRPHFLQFGSEDEIQVTADHTIRPIICPRDISRLPWCTGYSETINAGKSRLNEDQAVVHIGRLTRTFPLHTPPRQAPPQPPTSPLHMLNGGGEREAGEGEGGHQQTLQTTSKHSTSSLSVSPATELKEEIVLPLPTSQTPGHSSSTSDPGGDAAATSLPQTNPPSTTVTPSESAPTTTTLSDSQSTAPSPTSTSQEPSITTIHLSPSQKSTSTTEPSSTQPSTTTTQCSITSTTTAQPSSTTQPSTTTIQSSTTTTQPSTTTTQPSTTSTQPSTTTSQASTSTQPPTGTMSLPYYLFGVFDGHAGWGAAVAAANQLHHIIHEKLCDVIDILLPEPQQGGQNAASGPHWTPYRKVTLEQAITGALENAFWQMDRTIEEDRLRYQLSGGCTACVALFIHGRLFLANAGDSRATLSLAGCPEPMSFDFTPETETQRIRKLGAMHPELLGGEFTHLDFIRRPSRSDIGKRVMFRDHYMTGWAYKTLTQDDLKYPLVCGEGKRSRVLATIGVTRGFGDHDLKAQCSSIPIKPFLTPEPEVRICNLMTTELSDGDVLILATDGLWDITSNEKAVATVAKSLAHFPQSDQDKYKYRYTSAAQDLVMGSRGKLREENWRTSDDKHATIDDISVFVIPIHPYQEEHRAWLARQTADWERYIHKNESHERHVDLAKSNSVAEDLTSKQLRTTQTSLSPEDCSDLNPCDNYFKCESEPQTDNPKPL